MVPVRLFFLQIQRHLNDLRTWYAAYRMIDHAGTSHETRRARVTSVTKFGLRHRTTHNPL
jgi:hypothetical protein